MTSDFALLPGWTGTTVFDSLTAVSFRCIPNSIDEGESELALTGNGRWARMGCTCCRLSEPDDEAGKPLIKSDNLVLPVALPAGKAGGGGGSSSSSSSNSSSSSSSEFRIDRFDARARDAQGSFAIDNFRVAAPLPQKPASPRRHTPGGRYSKLRPPSTMLDDTTDESSLSDSQSESEGGNNS